MTIESDIYHAKQLSNWFSDNVDGLSIIPGHNNKLAAACFSLVLDHHMAVIILIENGRYSSAAALMRVHFDTYVRGCWLAFIADENAVRRFEEGKPPFMSVMIRALETHDAFNSGVLWNVKERTWSILSDFAHSGIEQISRNLNGTFIDHNYSLQEIAEILRQTSSLALLSVSQIGALTNNYELIEQANQRAQSFWTYREQD
tara:strand:- start:118 stop:723 length:606 start_codon:yes stop_codon:yes gene_type:complete